MKQDDIIRNTIATAISNTKTYFQERVEDVLRSAIDEQIERINDGEDTDAGRDELLNDVSRKIAKMVLFRLAIESLPDVKIKDEDGVRDIGLDQPQLKTDCHHNNFIHNRRNDDFSKDFQRAVTFCLEGVQTSAEKVDKVKKNVIHNKVTIRYDFKANARYYSYIEMKRAIDILVGEYLMDYVNDRIIDTISGSVITSAGPLISSAAYSTKDEFIFEKTIVIIHH